MKQVIFVLAMALMLVATIGTNTEASQYPYGYGPVDRDIGDDHPWGGEGFAGDNPLLAPSPAKDQFDFSTSVSSYDFFMWKLIIPLWIIDSPKSDASISDDIDDGTNTNINDRKRNETTSSNN
ncbi:MAG: hypothetical protein U9N55_02525 [candidate division Zixibacteria bacterium]|nr:hypothetical protein [candidate division Zixibacteria bacterium]